jgi:hypothetical protein
LVLGQELVTKLAWRPFTQKKINVPPQDFMKTDYEKATINALSIWTGIDRRTIQKRLLAHNVRPVATRGNSIIYKCPEAIRAIYADHHERGELARANERLTALKAEALERELEVERGLESGQLMRTDDVLSLFKNGFQTLDNIKSRAMNEIGMDANKATALEKLVDSIRNEWTANLEEL